MRNFIVLTTVPIVMLLGDSPWTANVKVSQDPGTGSQNETTIAVFNDTLICAGWNDDRQGSWRAGFAASTDGGATWHRETLMVAPSYVIACDPCLVVDDSGSIYYFYLCAGVSTNKVFFSQSTDWGLTWSDAVCATPVVTFPADKPWALIDGANIFLTWMEFNEIYFARSTDLGQTWPVGIKVSQYTVGNGSMPIRGTDSLVYVGWGRQAMLFTRSTNMGQTWSPQDTIIPVVWNPGSTPYRLNNIPCFTTSIDRAELYTVFADSRLGANQVDVFFSKSTNQGLTWSLPLKINDTPAGDTSLQFYPWLAVDPAGNLHAEWYDTRGSTRLFVARYYAYSVDDGATWSLNERVSDVSAYTTDFIGDYATGCANAGHVFALWCDCRNGSQNPDVFFSRRINDVEIKERQPAAGQDHDLKLAFANPFTAATRIVFSPASAKLTIYQADGRRVDRVSANGVYILRLEKDGRSITRKLVKID